MGRLLSLAELREGLLPEVLWESGALPTRGLDGLSQKEPVIGDGCQSRLGR
jgi:hypothetical protein